MQPVRPDSHRESGGLHLFLEMFSIQLPVNFCPFELDPMASLHNVFHAPRCTWDTCERALLTMHRKRRLRIGQDSFVGLIALIFALVTLHVESLSQPLATGKSKLLGCSIRSVPATFGNYWNQVTPEDAGKWGSVEGTRDSYNWSPLDNIYNYAVNNNFPFRYHTLVWGQQQPGWINSLDVATQRAQIEEWFQLVGARYPKMAFVDVVNEPFNAPPAYKQALGGDGVTGWDWVITAFQWARKYCAPGVKLFLNEYNVLHSNPATTNYLALIDTLKVRGLIDGIGIQGHYFEFKSFAGGTPSYTWPIATIESNLNRLVATGIPVHITEFDINEADSNIQLQNCQTYFPLFWDNPGVTCITLWGYLEYYVWKQNAFLIDWRGARRPALDWLITYVRSPFRPLVSSPNGVIDVPRNAVLKWRSSETAASYRVQVSTSGLFVPLLVDTTATDTALTLKPLDAHTRFYWRVRATNTHGSSEYSATASFYTGSLIVSVGEREIIPSEFALFQNYPNPFNPSTTISYHIPKSAHVSVSVHDVFGRVIANLVEGIQVGSRYSVDWTPSGLGSGVYFVRLVAQSEDGTASYSSTKKILFTK